MAAVTFESTCKSANSVQEHLFVEASPVVDIDECLHHIIPLASPNHITNSLPSIILIVWRIDPIFPIQIRILNLVQNILHIIERPDLETRQYPIHHALSPQLYSTHIYPQLLPLLLPTKRCVLKIQQNACPAAWTEPMWYKRFSKRVLCELILAAEKHHVRT